MAKKYNKGRKQKPNYSKRGMGNFHVELGSETNIEEKVKCAQDPIQCDKPLKKR